jgi:hypothetical protein
MVSSSRNIFFVVNIFHNKSVTCAKKKEDETLIMEEVLFDDFYFLDSVR